MSQLKQIGNLREDTKKFSNPQTGRVYDINGISPTISTCQGEIENRKYWLRWIKI
jgi:DNA (cytosine-5)-methyltransferase 1